MRFTRLPGLGAKTARRIHDELGISTLEELRAAAEQERLRSVPGIGPKAEQNIARALSQLEEEGPAERLLLSAVLTIGEEIVEHLRAHPAADRVEIAGSARRMTDTCKDLDIIATADDPAALTRAFAEMQLLASVGSSGEAGARGVTHNGLRIDFRVVEPDQYGNVLQHLTGSKQHNVELREYAVRRGMHVSEYGVEEDESGTVHRCPTEEGVYEVLGLPYIEPELREGRGELEAARAGTLPQLVTEADLRGDLHCHTTLSDGRSSLEDMARAAEARGYEYLAVTDHSASHGFGNDVQADELLRPGRADPGAERAARHVARAGRLGGEHQPRRLARLRGRRARRARLGRRFDAHVVPHGRAGHDRAHDGRDGPSPRGRDRPPDRPPDPAP